MQHVKEKQYCFAYDLDIDILILHYIRRKENDNNAIFLKVFYTFF